MNKLRVIDLLNKIANGEEVPKKITFCFKTFEYHGGIDDYLCIDKNDYTKEDYCNGYSIHKWIFGNNLNDTVKIIEEEKKIPEKIKDKYCSQISKVELAQKYNEIIDYLDYIKSKGE